MDTISSWIRRPRVKLTDLAYELLEEAIVTLRLPPGCVVSEQSLAEMTGIGRTPIREAIQRLAREHLILFLPRRGFLVSEVDLSKQLKLLETRREIERLICRSAARRAREDERENFARLAQDFLKAGAANDYVSFMQSDREFNKLCLTSSRNQFAERAMRSLYGLSRRFWHLHFKQQPNMLEIARLYSSVALAISTADATAAGESLDRLIDRIEHYALATVLCEALRLDEGPQA